MVHFFQQQPDKSSWSHIAEALGTGLGGGFEEGMSSQIQKMLEQKKQVTQGEAIANFLETRDPRALSKLPPNLQAAFANDLIQRPQKEAQKAAYAQGLNTLYGSGVDQFGQPGFGGNQPMQQAPQQVPQMQAAPGTQFPDQAQQMQPQQPQQLSPQQAQQGQQPIKPPKITAKQRQEQFMKVIQDAAPEDRRELLKQFNEERKLGLEANKEFKAEVLRGREQYTQKKNVLRQMENLNDKEELTTPFMATLLKKLDLPIGFLSNPSSEEFEKLTQQLMSDIQSVYGTRLNQLEVENYAKSIPSLLNSKEGRQRVIRDLQNLNESRKITFDTYMDLSEKGTNLPINLREEVVEQAQEEIERRADQFAEQITRYKPLRMFKNGKAYNIPVMDVQGAILKGFNTNESQ